MLEPVRADVAVIEVVDDDLLGLAYHRGVWLNGPARRALEESEAVCLVDDDLLGLAYHRGVWLNGPARRALEESEAVCL